VAPHMAAGDDSISEVVVLLIWVAIGIISWIVNRVRRAMEKSRAEAERVRSGGDRPQGKPVPPSLQALLEALEAKGHRTASPEPPSQEGAESGEDFERPERLERLERLDEAPEPDEPGPVEETPPEAVAEPIETEDAAAEARRRAEYLARVRSAEARVLEAERVAEAARDAALDAEAPPAPVESNMPAGESVGHTQVTTSARAAAGVAFPALLRRGASQGEVRSAIAWACVLGPPRGTVPHGEGDFLGPPGGIPPSD
jgi:hypothetical protein